MKGNGENTYSLNYLCHFLKITVFSLSHFKQLTMASRLSKFAKSIDPRRLFSYSVDDHKSVDSVDNSADDSKSVDSIDNLSEMATRGRVNMNGATPSASSGPSTSSGVSSRTSTRGRGSINGATPSASSGPSTSSGVSSQTPSASSESNNLSSDDRMNSCSFGDDEGGEFLSTDMPPLPAVINTTAFAELQARFDAMKRGRDEMRSHLLQIAEDRKLCEGHSTVRINGRRPQYVGEDASNYIALMPKVDEFFVNEKLLEINWNLFSPEAKDSICGRVMGDMTVPFEYGAESYWNDVIVPMFLCKFRNLKTNYMAVVKREYLGECGDVVVVYSFMCADCALL